MAPTAVVSSDPFSDPHPPRPPPKKRMPAPVPHSAPTGRDAYGRELTDAVKDTVHVRGNSTTDYSPRHLGRSQTAIPAPASSPRNPNMGRRSHSQDSVPAISQERPKSSKSRTKKGSQHADVIDRLDFTGVGPMFHHDGPFDACAPSRNKHPRKAPMAAWSPADQPNDGPYPSATTFNAFSGYDAPKNRKVDAIAEAWGIHEPEPFEEFFAGGGARGDTPASSIHNGREGHRSTPKRIKENQREAHADEPSRSRGTRRTMPPPRPIFVPESRDEYPDPSGSPPAQSPGLPKRTKSLMHRIRKMRESPNVPVDSDYEPYPPSSPSPPPVDHHGVRPTHRPQNSFLGRFGKAEPAHSEPFILVEPHTNKELPTLPPQSPTVTPSSSYFDGHASGGNVGSPGGGLGRKTSLMKKMGRVVRGR